ncbi:unnamed protein product (macronuclear) [Paramecium tetraurelia]|uniref:Thioredoxin domain-containing protein n=1 Tax=Paramecium tetraurelia TaxID=5888 RepID=A0DK53_PARTE|nr:uncharacterized protein GSPATT00017749001 [Paramecium tetraurelia]CAK83420.1 unnamed protein product [Paramecium tetraurelia]|eukprot:XP_001450817.1 hypothetical protein (macronuclear) [Paramecium tetraurelia strain d4-2]
MILVLLVNLILATGKLKQHHLNHQVMFKRENEVVVLDASNFDAALMRFEVLLVDFYAPWCPHCQKLMPQFEEAANILKQRKSKINLAKVDCTKESFLCHESEVRGYPTLRVFYHDKRFPYLGDRTSHGIVDFMEKHLKQEEEKEKQMLGYRHRHQEDLP